MVKGSVSGVVYGVWNCMVWGVYGVGEWGLCVGYGVWECVVCMEWESVWCGRVYGVGECME